MTPVLETDKPCELPYGILSRPGGLSSTNSRNPCCRSRVSRSLACPLLDWLAICCGSGHAAAPKRTGIRDPPGPVGTTAGTGGLKRYAYDKCGATAPPPYYPTTGHFARGQQYLVDPAGFEVGDLYNFLTSN